MNTTETLLYQTALIYLQAGLSILPIQWAEKRPAGYLLPQVEGRATWNPYRVRLATVREARRWFTGGGADALAIVTGPISGGLEGLDFDAPELYAPWAALVQSQATILDGLPVVQSRSGGYHVYYRYRTDHPAGNQKLAEDPARAKRTLIETRGAGGYLVAPPSRAYTLLQGDLTAIPVLSADERALLLDAARTLDQVPPRPAPRPAGVRTGRATRPGDDFNRHGDVAALLESHGWRRVCQRGAESYWCRPGKARGVSATLNYRGPGLYVFSSNAAPFEPGRAYSPFSVLALLEYGGDFRAAAQALRARGYGETQC